MDKVDREMESRVWQRVRERKPEQELSAPQRDNLKPWVLAAQENAVACRNLQLQLIGKQWEPLRRLETESARMVQCLRGVCALRGEPVKLTALQSPKDPSRRALEKCFRRAVKLREEMARRSGDPECGVVFRTLSDRAGEHCAVLAELIGKLE